MKREIMNVFVATETAEAFSRRLRRLISSDTQRFATHLESVARVVDGPSAVQIRSWSFELPDDDFGIKTIIDVFGRGRTIRSHRCYRISHYNAMMYAKNDRAEDNILTFSNKDESNLAAIWGGIKDAYDPEYVFNKEWALEERALETSVYQLRPGLPDGGFVTHCVSSKTTLYAVKIGNVWTVSFAGITSFTLIPCYQKCKTVRKSLAPQYLCRFLRVPAVKIVY